MSAVGLAFVLWLQMRCRKTNKSSVNAITTKISSRWNWNEVIDRPFRNECEAQACVSAINPGEG